MANFQNFLKLKTFTCFVGKRVAWNYGGGENTIARKKISTFWHLQKMKRGVTDPWSRRYSTMPLLAETMASDWTTSWFPGAWRRTGRGDFRRTRYLDEGEETDSATKRVRGTEDCSRITSLRHRRLTRALLRSKKTKERNPVLLGRRFASGRLSVRLSVRPANARKKNEAIRILDFLFFFVDSSSLRDLSWKVGLH